VGRCLRILVDVAGVAAAVLCAATLSLWVRSYRHIDEFAYSPRAGVNYSAVTRPGLCVLSRTVLTGRTTDIFSDGAERGPGRSFTSRPRPPGPSVSPFTPEGSPAIVQWFGLDYLARDQSRPFFGNLSFRRIIVPMWLVALVTALPPLSVVVLRARRARRGALGLCPACGYDLRATPTKCPECGHVPTPAT
jgi:hypothetical protein